MKKYIVIILFTILCVSCTQTERKIETINELKNEIRYSNTLGKEMYGAEYVVQLVIDGTDYYFSTFNDFEKFFDVNNSQITNIFLNGSIRYDWNSMQKILSILAKKDMYPDVFHIEISMENFKSRVVNQTLIPEIVEALAKVPGKNLAIGFDYDSYDDDMEELIIPYEHAKVLLETPLEKTLSIRTPSGISCYFLDKNREKQKILKKNGTPKLFCSPMQEYIYDGGVMGASAKDKEFVETYLEASGEKN